MEWPWIRVLRVIKNPKATVAFAQGTSVPPEEGGTFSVDRVISHLAVIECDIHGGRGPGWGFLQTLVNQRHE